MKSWNSVVFIKSKNNWSNPATISKMPGVDNIWSTSGKWDWCVKLDSDHSTPEKTKDFVSKLRSSDWVSETQTNWWQDLSDAR